MEIASARISAIAHTTEDPRKVVDALYQLCSEEKFHPKVEKRVVKGHFGNSITKVDFVLQSSSANSFFESLWTRLSHLDRATTLEELDSRIDAEGRFYLRIDKQECFRGILQKKDEDPIKVQVAFRGSSGSIEEIRQFLESVQS